MYKLVRLSCSLPIPAVEAADVGGAGTALSEADRVPPAEPEDDDDAVLAGDAAVGTRVPPPPQPPLIAPPVYCSRQKVRA